MQKKWTLERAKAIFNLPFNELIYEAQTVHRQHFSPNKIQVNTLLNIKTGGCSENCCYCPQSAHHATGVAEQPLMGLEDVLAAARRAKETGAGRLCMGAAGRAPHEEDLTRICQIISEVKQLGLETCVTLGLLKAGQAEQLKAAGLDFYNHNVDTSEDFYPKVVTTRTFQDRLDTINLVRAAGIKVCSGGIIGMGESNDDRIKMVVTLANLDEPPESVPINKLIRIPGTPLENQEEVDPVDFVRTIALTRILMPKSYLKLAAGREQMSDELQILCFVAGANSIFYGEKLLTADNPLPEKDELLFKRLGMEKL